MTRVRSALVFAFVVSGCAHAPAHVEIRAVQGASTQPVARSARAMHVRFEGNDLVSRGQLLDAIEEDDPERDVVRLLNAYYDRGFVQVKVDEPIMAGGATTFRIHEGHRFRIRNIEASGVTPDGLPTRAHIHARTGDWFSRRVWVDDLAAIRALYQDVGYACVAVTPQMSLDVEHDVVDVTVVADLGPRVTIERVEVIAPSPEIAARVRGSIHVAAGDLFRASKLEAARKDILATGRWKRVDLSYEIPLGTSTNVPDAKATIRYELTP